MKTPPPHAAPVRATPLSDKATSVKDRNRSLLRVAISSLLVSVLIVIMIILIRMKIWKEKDQMRAVAAIMTEKMRKRDSSTRITESKGQPTRKAEDIEDEEMWIHTLYDALW